MPPFQAQDTEADSFSQLCQWMAQCAEQLAGTSVTSVAVLLGSQNTGQ